MAKTRLDVLLVERQKVESRSLAQRLIMAGQVRVDGQILLKPSEKVDDHAQLDIDQGPKFVSRGGEKLEGAIQAFGLTDLSGKVCVDVGASTGGFTDCLLSYGAEKVFAIDVGYGILHWKIRQDRRVVVMERTNARFVNGFNEPIDLVVIDASFISLRTLLPVISQWFVGRPREIIALIKPQFEAGRQEVAKGEGVIRDPEIHRRVLLDMIQLFSQMELGIAGLIRSPLLGPKGNAEFLVHLKDGTGQKDPNTLIDGLLPD